ncbi:MAG: cupin domain-containing protein [Ignavibacteriaceae bacterium]|nr:cupin domain-containing protein [Ignavibacteriaceae bacterium]
MNYNADYWIRKLDLIKHPEGGYFREVYRSKEIIERGVLPSRYQGGRCFSTSIYFLLSGRDFSAFHRLKSDETWHFYSGIFLNLYVIDAEGKLSVVKIGNDPERGEVLQYTIPEGSWFAANPGTENSYSLIGCTVAPGFDFEDFELAGRDSLVSRFPQHKELITRFSHR